LFICHWCNILPHPSRAVGVGFSTNPAIANEALSFVLSPRNALPQTMQFLTLYPTNFIALDEMLACLHYWANPEVICINQDVPTYFACCATQSLTNGRNATG